MTIHSLGISFGALTLLLAACSAGNGGTNGNPDGGGQAKPDGSTGGVTGTISFPDQCSALQACGGDVVGTWDYTAGCVENPFTGLKSACPALTVTGLTGTAHGTLTFTATTVARNASATVAATISVPSSCAQPMGGCAGVQKQLTDAGLVATCAGAGDCSCSVSRSDSMDDSNGYTASGTTITLSTGDKYEYCVSSGMLGYKAVNQQKESGQFDLKKR